jgi:hypothetical protein
VSELRTWFGAEKLNDRDADIAAMNNDPRYGETFYLVEATHHERHAEWSRLSTQSPYCYDLRDIRNVDWVGTNPGHWERIGELAGHPVVVNLSWSYLNGALVCFYESTSRVVDWDVIESWLAKKFPNVRVKTNATNLHLVLQDIERERKS